MKEKARQEEILEEFLVREINNIPEYIYSINILSKDQGKPECMEAKEKELENLFNFGTFEEVKDKGQ